MYLALYRKYRPSTFDDVISQPHITKTLMNQVKNKQTAHAYLFTGSRGTGKTTCAKILSKAVNCLKPMEGNPCLTCEACLAIDHGVSDVIEIDAASNNSVDDVRALRDELNYLPVICKYRVYIIDETHMLSASAFNALLKTIEEPPNHVVFILATTETHKVPATILSRCQRFDFKRINLNDSASRLMEIAEKEGVKIEKDAALLISRLSEGGMRDALSLLDTCLSVSDFVTTDNVYDAVGIAGRDYLFQISNAVKDNNPGDAVSVINQLHEESKDITRLIDELIYHYRNFMLIKAVPENKDLLSCLPSDVEIYENFAKELTLNEILRSLRILENAFERIGRSKNAKITAEMAVIELSGPGIDLDLAATVARVNVLEEKLAGLPVTPYPNESYGSIPDKVSKEAGNYPAKDTIPKKTAAFPYENIKEMPFNDQNKLQRHSQKQETSQPAKTTFTEKKISSIEKQESHEAAAMSFFAEIPPPWDESPIPSSTANIPPPFNEQLAVDGKLKPPLDEKFEIREKPNGEPSFEEPTPIIEKPNNTNFNSRDFSPAPTPPSSGKISDTAIPFPQWKNLIAGMPPFLSELILDTNAFVEGEALLITGGAIAGGVLENPIYIDMILEQAEKIFGKKLSLRFKEITIQENKVKSRGELFLSLAMERGVNVKIK